MIGQQYHPHSLTGIKKKQIQFHGHNKTTFVFSLSHTCLLQHISMSTFNSLPQDGGEITIDKSVLSINIKTVISH